jgi:GNAT superfamily N-acetyltransferase
MEIVRFKPEKIDEVKELIDKTIDDCYKADYCPEAIVYFKKYHSKENILDDARAGYTVVFQDKFGIIGTGTLVGSEIKRVFVLKQYQGQGIGRLIMNHLEREAASRGVEKINLCASLISKEFYDVMGYVEDKKDAIDLGGGKCLGHYLMSKVIEVI